MVTISATYRIRLLHANGYLRNRSITRLRHDARIAAAFRHSASMLAPPDLLLCAFPTPALCRAATEYGSSRDIPVVLDIRDLWPDALVAKLPSFARQLVRQVLRSMSSDTRGACTAATAIIGTSPEFVEWGTRQGGRAPGPLDQAFPLAFPRRQCDDSSINEARLCWARDGVDFDRRWVVAFAGRLNYHFDFETVLDAARLLSSSHPEILFVICGDGDSAEGLRRAAKSLQNVKLPGWRCEKEVQALLRSADVGIAPYRNSPDFMASYPNKAIEYFAAGLPVVSSLGGKLRELLAEHDCGITYQNGAGHALAAILSELVSRPEVKARMAHNADKLYARTFVADEVYSQLERLLREILQIAQTRSRPDARDRI
ncbi:MAG: glycosyltransferase [Thermoanaerobaculia bacterium]